MSDQSTILVRGARQLLTLRGHSSARRGLALQELGIIPDGALLIRDGLIEHVGPTRRIENLADTRGAINVDASGSVVMPALIDPLAQVVFGHPAAGFHDWPGPSVETPDGPEEKLNPGYALTTTPAKRLELRTLSLLEAMLRHGTTTVGATSGLAIDAAGELKALRVLNTFSDQPLSVVPGCFAAHSVPFHLRQSRDRWVSEILDDILPLVRRRKLARFVDVMCDSNVFPMELARRVLEAATDLELPTRLHSQQFSEDDSLRLALSAGCAAIMHVERLRPSEVDLLASSPLIAILTPTSGLERGGGRFAPARLMIHAGAAVALATGFQPDDNPTYSMQLVLAFAARFLAMSPAEAICAATINAAHAIGCAATTGSLEPGKRADLLILRTGDYRDLTHFVGGNQVQTCMRGGKVVYQEGHVALA